MFMFKEKSVQIKIKILCCRVVFQRNTVYDDARVVVINIAVVKKQLTVARKSHHPLQARKVFQRGRSVMVT